MPDGQHIGAFLADSGRAPSGHLVQAASEKREDKIRTDKEKDAQQDFIHQMLLSSAEHNPDLAVNDYHKILRTVLVDRGEEGGGARGSDRQPVRSVGRTRREDFQERAKHRRVSEHRPR